MKGRLEFFSETGTEGGWCDFYEEGYGGYDGLRRIEAGDHLIIYDPKDYSMLFNGVIDFEEFEWGIALSHGMWVRRVQKGWDIEKWNEMFQKEYPAELIKR